MFDYILGINAYTPPRKKPDTGIKIDHSFPLQSTQTKRQAMCQDKAKMRFTCMENVTFLARRRNLAAAPREKQFAGSVFLKTIFSDPIRHSLSVSFRQSKHLSRSPNVTCMIYGVLQIWIVLVISIDKILLPWRQTTINQSNITYILLKNENIPLLILINIPKRYKPIISFIEQCVTVTSTL